MACVPEHLWIPSRGRCCYCKRKLRKQFTSRHYDDAPTREHIVPRSLGGTARLNLVLSCAKCNTARSNNPLSDDHFFRAKEAQAVRIAYLLASQFMEPFANKCVGGWHVKSANGV